MYTVVWTENSSDSRYSYESHRDPQKALRALEFIRAWVDPNATMRKGSPLDYLGKI